MYPRVLFSSTRSPSLYRPMTVTTIQPTMFRSGSCMTKTKAPRKTPVPMAPNCDAPLPRDEEDEGEGGRPDDVGDDLEMREDVRLVLHVGAEGRPEDGPEHLEERLRGDQDRDDDDPRTEL